MNFPHGQVLDARECHRQTLRCDAVVIGSGAGGAAVAWTLSRQGWSVLILEEGRLWKPSELVSKPSWAYRHLYVERSTRLMMGSAYIPLPGGRAVGGSTLLNSA